MAGKRQVALAAIAAAFLCFVACAPGAAAAPKLRVPVPQAGETTVAVAQVTYSGKAPSRVGLMPKNRAKLGPDVRGIYAVYRKRRGKRTVFTIFSLLLRRGPSGASGSAIAPAQASHADNAAFVFFFVSAGFRDDSVFEEHDEKLDVFYKLVAISTGQGDKTRPPKPALSLLESGGIVFPLPSDPFDLGPSLIDTGHYDDGHSFGWNSAGTKPAIADWLRLSANNAPYEELIESIERRMGEDLDGDGEVAAGGGRVDTEVGVPVIR